MQSSRNITKKWSNLGLGLLGLAMVAVSAYLTNHYYAVLFPTSYSVGSFCDISRFWNCDNAAFSTLSNIFNVPTSLFGVMFGLIIVFGAIARKAAITKTNFFLALMNLLGCVFLLGYSLLFLHGLCPGCTAYYVLSLLTVLVFLAQKPGSPLPRISHLAYYALFALLITCVAYGYNYERFKKQDALIAAWIEEVQKDTIHDDSDLGFQLPLIKSTPNFSDAPLRISLFSDFQCFYCKVLSKQLEKLAPRYEGKINIQYLFFPLDSQCNDSIGSPKHPLACAAARLSYCARNDFTEVHDDIYAHQDHLTEAWLSQKAQDLGLEECYTSEDTQVRIKALVDKGLAYKIEAAPFMLINGRAITGLIPNRALIGLLDAMLAEQTAK